MRILDLLFPWFLTRIAQVFLSVLSGVVWLFRRKLKIRVKAPFCGFRFGFVFSILPSGKQWAGHIHASIST
jgi:hypothetical protein